MRLGFLPVVTCLALGGALELAGCGGDDGGSGGSAGTSPGGSTSTGGTSAAGSTSAGTAGTSAGTTPGGSSSSGGSPAGGAAGTSATGGSSAGSGASGASAGGGGGAGGSAGTGGSGSGGWTCPPASSFTGSPLPGATATATRINGAPPADTFNNSGNDYTTVEGPVWIGDALYFSEMQNGNVPKSRILKLTADDNASEFIADAGSNGLATDGTNIISANHKAHGLVRFSLADKAASTLVSMASGKALNSPNDLVIAKSGTIYFTDPSYQNNANPQGATRVYQFAPGATEATAITDYTMQPNSIGLSFDEQTLIVGGQSGIKKYPISNGAVAMSGTAFGPSQVTMSGVNTDGLTQDCAGNLYVTVGDSANIVVVKPDGSLLGTITAVPKVTNVAFGGTDHQTLYITVQGSNKEQGVFKLHLNIPGLPY